MQFNLGVFIMKHGTVIGNQTRIKNCGSSHKKIIKSNGLNRQTGFA